MAYGKSFDDKAREQNSVTFILYHKRWTPKKKLQLNNVV